MDTKVIIDLIAGVTVGMLLTGRMRWGACTLAVIGGVAFYASRPSQEEKWYGLLLSLPIFFAIFAFGALAGSLLRSVVKR
jgi:hypothetical protein